MGIVKVFVGMKKIEQSGGDRDVAPASFPEARATTH
jgi:hypothetical protein